MADINLLRYHLKNLLKPIIKGYIQLTDVTMSMKQDSNIIFWVHNVFHKLTLNKKSLLKLFPENKQKINSILDKGNFTDDEEMVITVLKSF